MAWQLSGEWLEACSCKMVCPCTLGPAEPDRGWCSGSWVLLFHGGSSDGVDLSGTKVAVAVELPGDFFGGIDVARLYIDEAASPDQRRQLEAIITGTKGGVWEATGASIRKWLPAQVVPIEAVAGESPSFTVGNVGRGTYQRIKTEDGKQATLTNAPVAAASGMDTMELALSTGTRWSDPDMRQWESGGGGWIGPFNWSA